MSSIAGLDQKMEQVLKEKANVKSFKELYDATRTPAARAALAEKTNLPLANITHWSVQAELLRMDGMTQDEACDLIDAGIYSVNDFNKLSNKEIIEKVRKANSDTAYRQESVRYCRICQSLASGLHQYLPRLSYLEIWRHIHKSNLSHNYHFYRYIHIYHFS